MSTWRETISGESSNAIAYSYATVATEQRTPKTTVREDLPDVFSAPQFAVSFIARCCGSHQQLHKSASNPLEANVFGKLYLQRLSCFAPSRKIMKLQGVGFPSDAAVLLFLLVIETAEANAEWPSLLHLTDDWEVRPRRVWALELNNAAAERAF